MFLHLSVHRGGLPQCMLGYQPLWDQAPGTPPRPDTPPTPRDQANTPPPDQAPPPSRRLLLRTVRILLECILVSPARDPDLSYQTSRCDNRYDNVDICKCLKWKYFFKDRINDTDRQRCPIITIEIGAILTSIILSILSKLYLSFAHVMGMALRTTLWPFLSNYEQQKVTV